MEVEAATCNGEYALRRWPGWCEGVEEAVKSHCWVTPDIFGAGCPYLTM